MKLANKKEFFLAAFLAAVVIFVLAGCGGGGGSGSTSTTPPTVAIPAAPAAPAAAPTVTTLSNGWTLSWSAVSGATSYEVYRDGAKLVAVTTTSYSNNVGGSYSYTACNTAGCSAKSPAVSVTQTAWTIPAGKEITSACTTTNRCPIDSSSIYYADVVPSETVNGLIDGKSKYYLSIQNKSANSVRIGYVSKLTGEDSGLGGLTANDTTASHVYILANEVYLVWGNISGCAKIIHGNQGPDRTPVTCPQ